MRPVLVRIMLLAAFLSLAVPCVPSSGPGASLNAAAYGGIDVQLVHPTFAGTSEKVEVTLTLRGGPAEDTGGNYSYVAKIIATNMSGAQVSPERGGPSQSGVFKFNVTTPAAAKQTIKVEINATSTAQPSGNETYRVVQYSMKIVEPVVISATVFNEGAVAVDNATAQFYADGTLLGTKAFNVSAGSSAVVSYNWTFLSLKSGKHVVTVEVDDENDIVEFSDGNNVYSRTVYIGEQGDPAGIVLTVGVIVVAVFFALTYLQKPAKRGKKF